jgi:hypothetical protein
MMLDFWIVFRPESNVTQRSIFKATGSQTFGTEDSPGWDATMKSTQPLTLDT